MIDEKHSAEQNEAKPNQTKQERYEIRCKAQDKQTNKHIIAKQASKQASNQSIMSIERESIRREWYPSGIQSSNLHSINSIPPFSEPSIVPVYPISSG